tara:strand:+ start:197 stop:823 length:627 start_codon:yes stop_codon:yes gene_type:complete
MALVKYNNNSLSAITTPGTLASGAMVLIKSQTASSSSTINFVDGTSDVVLDNTYPIYLFQFINIHPSNDGVYFQFNLSVDSGSNYNVTKTSTVFQAYHNEAGSATSLEFQSGSMPLRQATGVQQIASDIGNDNDQNSCGYLYIFNPSSTTYVKHYLAKTQNAHSSNYTQNQFTGGYGNTTSAVDAVQFSMSAGNIDAGKIKLYGLKDS